MTAIGRGPAGRKSQSKLTKWAETRELDRRAVAIAARDGIPLMYAYLIAIHAPATQPATQPAPAA